MNDESTSDRVIAEIVKALGYAAAGIATYITVKEIPGIWRYVAMKRIAKHHDGATAALLPSMDSPQYAQAPRRANQGDEHKGHQRRASA